MSMAHNIGPIMADHDRGPEYALVQCIGGDFTCPAEARVEQSARLSDAEIAAVLAERGWSVSPTLCPAHRPADLVQGDAKLRGNSGDADATENHENGSGR